MFRDRLFRDRGVQRSGSSTREALSATLRQADEARDQKRYADAAELYRAALELAPRRTDIKVQMANMLKDSRRYAEAETAYLEAIAEFPSDADILLQLGHLRKLTGRRDQALEDYRKALVLNPHLSAARRELAAAGAASELMDTYEQHRREGALEALLMIRKRLDDMSDQIAALRNALPEASSAVAFPLDAYDDLRQLYDVPPPYDAPNAPGSETSIAVVLHADQAGDFGAFHRQLTTARDQTYSHWRVIVIGADPDRRAVVERAAASDRRISWIPASSEPIGAQERAAAGTSGAEWVIFLGHGACLHRRALEWVSAIDDRIGCAAIFFDEEIGGGGEDTPPLRPVLRHTFDLDTLLEANVYGETLAVSTRALAKLDTSPRATSLVGARSELLLALSKSERIAHAPLPLVRLDPNHGRSPDAAAADHADAVRAHLDEVSSSRLQPRTDAPGVPSAAPPPARPDAEISVIIPTRNNLIDLKGLIESLYTLAAHPEALSILLINNGDAKYRAEIDAAIAHRPTVAIMDLDEPFNWSRFNNIGANTTSATYLVFANDDMKMLTSHWDDIVRLRLERPDVGALGARLLYPNGTVQHAGILFGWQGSVIHDGLYEAKDAAGPAHRWQLTRSVSAVTGAFLATRRADFERLGGFDADHLAVSYSDVDYALKLRAQGLRILWSPAVTLYHYESKSRGPDHLHPAKAARDHEERRIVRARWPGQLDSEPGVNPMWRSTILPHRLLSFPSRDRIWSYVETGAKDNPWRVEPPSEPFAPRSAATPRSQIQIND